MFWSRLNYKYYLTLIIVQALIFTIVLCALFPHLDRNHKQLAFDNHSSYQYVFESNQGTSTNNYLNCTDKIQFSTDASMGQPLYVETFMLLPSVAYDDVAPFVLKNKLSSSEIAITRNVAAKYHLSVGTQVYSKHKVTNTLVEYTVKEILPVCYGLTQNDPKSNHGVIIMGTDESYIQNVAYSFSGFAENDPSAQIANENAGLISINSKRDQNSNLLLQTIISQAIICFLVCAIMVIGCKFHYDCQKSYYSRIAIDGYPIKKLTRAIIVDMMLPGMASLCISLVATCAILSAHNAFFSYHTTMIAVITNLVTLGLCTIIFTIKTKRV